MKPINSILLFYLAFSCFLLVGCAEDDKDAEFYAYRKSTESQAQPNLLPANEVASAERDIPVDLPKAHDEIQLSTSPEAVAKTDKPKHEPSVGKPQPNVKYSTKENKILLPPAPPEKSKPIKEVLLSPAGENKRTAEQAAKAKAMPSEVVSAPPVVPKVMRGAATTGQTRGLTPPVQNTIPNAKGAVPVLLQDEYDFGTVTEGAKVTHRFMLKNAGTEELYIMDVDAGCNCTATSYSFEPIKPGSSTPIDVVFDTNTKIGTQLKNVVISTNNGVKKARLKGTVMPKNKDY